MKLFLYGPSLVEMTRFIDLKIESIFRIAQEEESDTSAHLLTSEFLAQLIEKCDDLCWLILRIPEDLIGRRLLKKYFDAFEAVIKTLLGMERIWWAIRRRDSGLPRNRDYSTVHLFAILRTDSLDDARDQFHIWINELNESISPLKHVNTIANSNNPCDIEYRSSRIVFIAFHMVKRSHLNTAFKLKDQGQLIDGILDSSEDLILSVKDLTISILMNPPSLLEIYRQSLAINQRLNQLIGLLQVDEEDEWFKDRLKEIDEICEEINENSPIR